jgi:ABC-type multidrug transport system ATPase subunit
VISAFIGIDFALMLVFYFLATGSMVSFTFALIALRPTQAMGRVVALGSLMLFFVLFFWGRFAFLFDDNGWYEKHILSIFPVAAIPYTLAQMVTGNCLSFSRISFPEYYPVSTGLTYMAVETVVYYVIYVLADYCMRYKWFPPQFTWSRNEPSHPTGIKVEILEKVYGVTIAVNSVSFKVGMGETLAIIGPNGSGKSSLLGMIAAASESASGRVMLGDVDITRNINTMHRASGFCPQDNIFMNELNVVEWIKAICTLRGEPNFDYADLFAALGLDRQTQVRIGDMSGGNKRKVCLATALVCNPSIVILDEATSGVDFTSRTRIWSLVAGLKETTVIMATHTLEECEKIADRIMVLSEGAISVIGTPTQLRQSFKCGYLLEADLTHADELEQIVRDESIAAEVERTEQGVRIVIPADEHQSLSRVLHQINFHYLMSIQSLEEKIFSHIQETEFEGFLRRNGEIDAMDTERHPLV